MDDKIDQTDVHLDEQFVPSTSRQEGCSVGFHGASELGRN